MKLISLILCFPKTFFYNIKLFGLKKGIRMPVLIGNKTKISLKKHAKIIVDENTKMFGIKIGINTGSFNIANRKTEVILNGGNLVLGRHIDINKGVYIEIKENASIIIGDYCSFNANCIIVSSAIIHIGNDCIFGWNVFLSTGDGHKVLTEGNKNYRDYNILIGKHSWISANVCILKGSEIPEGSVISINSLVNKKFDAENVLIGGQPAKVLKHNILWKR